MQRSTLLRLTSMDKSLKERGWKLKDAQVFRGYLIVIPETENGTEHPHCAPIDDIPIRRMAMINRETKESIDLKYEYPNHKEDETCK